MRTNLIGRLKKRWVISRGYDSFGFAKIVSGKETPSGVADAGQGIPDIRVL
jgi:hypothetical protein